MIEVISKVQCVWYIIKAQLGSLDFRIMLGHENTTSNAAKVTAIVYTSQISTLILLAVSVLIGV